MLHMQLLEGHSQWHQPTDLWCTKVVPSQQRSEKQTEMNSESLLQGSLNASIGPAADERQLCKSCSSAAQVASAA